MFRVLSERARSRLTAYWILFGLFLVSLAFCCYVSQCPWCVIWCYVALAAMFCVSLLKCVYSCYVEADQMAILCLDDGTWYEVRGPAEIVYPLCRLRFVRPPYDLNFPPLYDSGTGETVTMMTQFGFNSLILLTI